MYKSSVINGPSDDTFAILPSPALESRHGLHYQAMSLLHRRISYTLADVRAWMNNCIIKKIVEWFCFHPCPYATYLHGLYFINWRAGKKNKSWNQTNPLALVDGSLIINRRSNYRDVIYHHAFYILHGLYFINWRTGKKTNRETKLIPWPSSMDLLS